MEHISGTVQFLEVIKKEGSTYHLKTEEDTYIRMNASTSDEEYEIGEEISAFIYPNRSGELFAAPVVPSVGIDKYGFAKVSEVNRDGAYVDIGAPREILVPWIDLPKLKSVWPEEGDEIYMKLRAESDNQLYGRLISENEVAERFTPLKKEDFAELKNKWMEGRPYRLLKVGTFLLTDDGRKVFVHESEREDEPRLGELKKFRVIGINDEGEINGSFLKQAYKKMDDDSGRILDYLTKNGGSMPLNDKSSPEDIKEAFNMSKGAFKRALGRLMKEGTIEQTATETKMKEQ
ncbi:MAG TPA: RNA-binding protein [Candidatus Salinicoccus stercoripullorum]|uniref:Conserved virulence factor B n=1 Tax=Candidatus Salinicoccus stercoripullorum TaxID=2838756 RepID=A0A9D1QHZ1_9STAP|nr:RNA-binding protein [Candidatus Salinicoccus stercoripullorum]